MKPFTCFKWRDFEEKENNIFSELKPLYHFISFSTILLLIWSATTGSIFIYAGFENISQKWEYALPPTLLVVLFLETSKYYLGTYTFKFIFNGWLKRLGQHTFIFLIILPLSVVIFYSSFYLSRNGAPMISEFIAKKNITLPPVKRDSINEYYDVKLNAIALKIEEAQNTKWNGITTKHGANLAIELQKQANAIEEQKRKNLELAIRSHSLELDELATDTQTWGDWLAKFGGLGELLTLLFLAFKQSFNRGISNNSSQSKDNESLDHDVDEKPSNCKEIHFNGKSYSITQFKDRMNKTRKRAESSKTEKARKRNNDRYEEMTSIWNDYNNSINPKNQLQ